MDDKLVRKTYQASETKFLDDSRSLLVKISTGTPDRSKDIVVPDGVNLTNYMKNPVVALAHKYDGLAIAKTEEIKVVDNGIIAKVTFPDKEIYPLADTVFELYKGGFMNAWSIGFMPLEVQDIEGGGRQFNKWELLEYSAVLVPDNPEALTLLRSKGFKTEEIEKLIAEDKIEDKGVIPFKDTPEEKDRLVIRGRNRKLVAGAVEILEQATISLKELLEAKEPEEGDVSNEDQKLVLGLVSALRLSDQVVGVALRDFKAKLKELGIVPEDFLQPEGVKDEEGGDK